MRVTVIGAGRVGLTTALALEYIGYDVTCVDSSPAVAEALKDRRVPFHDPALEALIPASNLTVQTSLSAEAFRGEGIVIAVPTPPAADGSADLSAVDSVARNVATLCPQGAHVVLAVKSTVPPGTTDRLQAAVDAGLTERGIRAAVSVAAIPEFLRQGSAFADTLYPDRIVIGSRDQHADAVLREMYRPVIEKSFEPPEGLRAGSPVDGDVPVLSTTPVNAELIKYGTNSYLALRLSFVNEIARIAERLGGDIEAVARGLGMDPRIGSQYLQAGPGWGGPCLGKDSSALSTVAAGAGVSAPLLDALRETNAVQRHNVVDRLEGALGSLEGLTIGVLGLSFKANTDDVTDSPALDVIELLLDRGARVKAYDPAGEERASRQKPELAVQYHHAAEQMADGCDALLLMTEWEQFRDLPWASIAPHVSRRLILDTRNLLDRDALEAAGFTCLGLGR